MSCLSVNIRKVSGLEATMTRQGGIDASLRKIGGITASLRKAGGLSADISRQGGLTANIYLVCTVGTRKYLRVTPEEPMWITLGHDLTYTVRSNTDWIVL